MEISEAINKRIRLEADILELINKFEEETGAIVGYINFSRIACNELGAQIEKSFPIIDIEAHL